MSAEPRRTRGATPRELPPGAEPDDHIFVDSVVKSFGDTQVLKGVTMHLKRHKTAVIIGGSGAGKTTLLRLLIALERPTSGHIWVDGHDISPLSEPELNVVRQQFGMVFQYAALLDSLTVFDNVAFPLREHRKQMKRREMRDKVLSMLSLLGLEGKENRMPSELSGGQRKRVGLARALMLEPEILIYDEPTSGLDPITSRMVDDLIEETRARFDVTSVVISHDMTSTFRIAHQAFLLVQGQVIASGKPDDLAYGSVDAAREFIAASGIAPERINRVDNQAEGERTIKYKAM
ncbi:MAG: ATP-binding cassette domain-containing protein [Myxococcales bacterium]|nr:ATP-binding cassette domain-containing protein [Myxococcales bacterium]